MNAGRAGSLSGTATRSAAVAAAAANIIGTQSVAVMNNRAAALAKLRGNSCHGFSEAANAQFKRRPPLAGMQVMSFAASFSQLRALPTMFGKEMNLLVMALTNVNVSVQSFDFDFRTAGGDSSSAVAVRVENKLAALAFFDRLARRQRRHLKVGEDFAVEGLETQIGGELGHKVKIDISVQRGKR